MKKLTTIFALALLSVSLISQTHIANVNHDDATANHNQRKIVRDSNDNAYVVFVDWVDQMNVIKGLSLDREDSQWTEPVVIVDGHNPTLAISQNNEIYLLYESNGSFPEIMYTATSDFVSWSEPQAISEAGYVCKVPVADVDSSGNLNVFWQQKNNDQTEALMYARLLGGEMQVHDTVMVKDQIDDIAIANHLQYANDNLFFALQFNQDSVSFYFSNDRMESFTTVYSTQGEQPCISYNSIWEFYFSGTARFLYITEDEYTDNKLFEVEAIEDFNGTSVIITDPYEMPFWDVSLVCIDDISPPIGYSFISVNEYGMVHTFSYGHFYNNWTTNMEYLSGNSSFNPSIAYKHFSPEYIDFIWTNNSANPEGIYYLRDAKYIWTGLDDPETGKGFSITGSPNPFRDQINLKIITEDENVVPEIKIYNLNGQQVLALTIMKVKEKHFEATWTGTDESGLKVRPGVFVMMVSAGNVHTARKIVFEP